MEAVTPQQTPHRFKAPPGVASRLTREGLRPGTPPSGQRQPRGPEHQGVSAGRGRASLRSTPATCGRRARPPPRPPEGQAGPTRTRCAIGRAASVLSDVTQGSAQNENEARVPKSSSTFRRRQQSRKPSTGPSECPGHSARPGRTGGAGCGPPAPRALHAPRLPGFPLSLRRLTVRRPHHLSLPSTATSHPRKSLGTPSRARRQWQRRLTLLHCSPELGFSR